MAMLKEFKEFLLKQNVVALAIAVVVGTALNTLVKAVVDDFIMPIIVVIGPGGDWQTATWSVGSVKFGVGDFLAAVINFIIIGFRCVAHLEGLHQARGGKAKARLPVLSLADRSRGDSLCSLHEPALARLRG